MLVTGYFGIQKRQTLSLCYHQCRRYE